MSTSEGSSVTSENVEEEGNVEKEFKLNVSWVIPQTLTSMTFIGKDVCAIAEDVYIIFLNLKTGAEKVYVADNPSSGDGVDCVAGHRGNIFAFAEKAKDPRIFIMTYPNFDILMEFRDPDVTRYKRLSMMESELLATLGGFPAYTVAVWSWRSGQRLASVPTRAPRRDQLLLASGTHQLFVQCWGDGLTVWEVAQSHRQCLLLPRRRRPRAWDPPGALVGLCFTPDGALHAVDERADMYSITSDGVGAVARLEWSDDVRGGHAPCVCALAAGVLVYGPDQCLRYLRKTDGKWAAAAAWRAADAAAALCGGAAGDAAALWTRTGRVYRVAVNEDTLDVQLVAFKQRDIVRMQLLAPACEHVVTLSRGGELCLYRARTAELVQMRAVCGGDVSAHASPAEPALAVLAEVGPHYGVAIYRVSPTSMERTDSACLSVQIVSRVEFSRDGRVLVAAAMSAGHLFIYQLSTDLRLSLVRYAELGRGLADCTLLPVGAAVRCLSLVLVSDKYSIGERIVCIDTTTGKDNKLSGKMSGPYRRLMPTGAGELCAVPHHSTALHLIRLTGEKNNVVAKMAGVVETGHALRHFDALCVGAALLTFGLDGRVVRRVPADPHTEVYSVCASHRYGGGVAAAATDGALLVTLCAAHLAVRRPAAEDDGEEVKPRPPPAALLDAPETLTVISATDPTYLDVQEARRVAGEAQLFRQDRQNVITSFKHIQKQVVQLLEANLRAPPLHRLSLSEFNLNLEHKNFRSKKAELEREEIRLSTEALMRAQAAAAAWLRGACWAAAAAPRAKCLAIYSHYQVENYAVVAGQRERWPELQQTEALRALELEEPPFTPWDDAPDPEPALETLGPASSRGSALGREVSSVSASTAAAAAAAPEETPPSARVLGGDAAHRFVEPSALAVPQAAAYSYLHMYWMQHMVRSSGQQLRQWFNKQFDELMAQKAREVGLMLERNARLRFCVEELNTLSDLRGSFHHLSPRITDPQWSQDEQPARLVTVDPAECSIEPYISPSQVVVPPPEPQPKDDFKERALNEMMDGVLEKLWHEEIKKPIPKPQCMLDKEPAHFNEEDLRLVFEWEARAARRCEERDKYRKMLHAEYAKLAAALNEGVVNFNMKVKDMWLCRMRVDSAINQQLLMLMRLRRTNLDRLEDAEEIEAIRAEVCVYEREAEELRAQARRTAELGADCRALYDALAAKDRQLEKQFKNHFGDLSQIVVDQCYKFYRKRPKWHQRAGAQPAALAELAGCVAAARAAPRLPPDCQDYLKAVEQLDLVAHMPPVLDEAAWLAVCRLRRAKIENEIRMRGVALEASATDAALHAWEGAEQARRAAAAAAAAALARRRQRAEERARDRVVQFVIPSGQVEIPTTGHVEDFAEAVLIPREDIDTINDIIMKVGDIKLRMMKRQIEFRRGILSKEWEHARAQIQLRHAQQELQSYTRLKIPKELQRFLKNRTLGVTDEQEWARQERAAAAQQGSLAARLRTLRAHHDQLQSRMDALEAAGARLERQLGALRVRVSERRVHADPFEPIRRRRLHRDRMLTLVARSRLVRQVQASHAAAALLQTELELLRLKTFPTLAAFRTLL